MKRRALTKSQRFDVLRRFNFCCFYCGLASPVVILHVDHLWPVSRGGSNHPSNLVASCTDCNLGKADSEPSDMMIERARDLWCSHMDVRGLPTYVCKYCERAFIIDPEDDPAEVRAIAQCHRCCDIMCDSYDEGVKVGRGGV